MSRKRRNRGNNNRNRNNQLKKYNNFQDIPSTNRESNKNKLVLHPNFEEILKNILKDNKDPIAFRLIDDTKKPSIPTRISWLNITQSKDHLSYALPSKVKKPGDEWDKLNRQPNQIKKLIRKIYGSIFSNNQIKSFIGKFKNHYSQFTKKPVKKLTQEDTILDNLTKETYDGDMKWTLAGSSISYDKYTTEIFITDKKHVLVQYYDMKEGKPFISMKMVTDTEENFIRSIMDPIGKIKDLKVFIID